MARWVYSWIVYKTLKTLEWRKLFYTLSLYALIKYIATDQLCGLTIRYRSAN